MPVAPVVEEEAFEGFDAGGVFARWLGKEEFQGTLRVVLQQTVGEESLPVPGASKSLLVKVVHHSELNDFFQGLQDF